MEKANSFSFLFVLFNQKQCKSPQKMNRIEVSAHSGSSKNEANKRKKCIFYGLNGIIIFFRVCSESIELCAYFIPFPSNKI